jgi:hypothetical protein
MNWWGSGFITQIIYAGLAGQVDDSLGILTESDLNILSENGLNIDTES